MMQNTEHTAAPLLVRGGRVHDAVHPEPQQIDLLLENGRLVFALPAFAASDPLVVVENLSTFIFSLIRAVGLILLGWGIVQVGLSLQSHDPH